MALRDTIASKNCQINWELLGSIQNKSLCDMASCFVESIYTYHKITAEFADMQRALEYSEAKNKSLSEKYKSIESSKKAECEHLQKIIDEKEESVQTLSAKLNELYLTNNTSNALTPQNNYIERAALENSRIIQADKTPKNEADTPFNSQSSIEFMSLNDEVISFNDTVNEINGTPPINNRFSQTPTGRCSPIISARKIKPKLRDNGPKELVSSNRNLPNNSPLETKVKKLKQGRLMFSELKLSKVIDVSHTESFCGGTRSNLHIEKDDIKNTSSRVAPEDDEVILPSPTSDITRLQFQPISKRSLRSMNKPSPQKSKQNMSVIKAEFKPEDIHVDADATNCIESELDVQTTSNKSMAAPLVNSYPTKKRSTKKKSPLCLNKNACNVSNTCTQYNTNVSLSVLDGQHVVSKENVDICMVKQEDTKLDTFKQDDIKPFNKREPQFIYKEDPVRKKADKRKLQGWCCHNCKEFYEELYKDDEKKLEEAKQKYSKHRGKFNPERCATPPGFWDIRFSPPEDTEAFNRQNNV